MYAGHFDFSKPLLWTVDGFFDAAECGRILASAEGHQWLPATVNRLKGREVDDTMRNNTTAILRDPELAESCFARARPHVPASMTTEVQGKRMELEVCGLHLPLRIYRYDEGQFFGLHQDQSYFGPDESQSLLTFMVYLNEGFEGGETDFPEQERTIVPVVGTALLFQHRVLHAGRAVTRGRKYVLRSDVLYTPRSAPNL